MNTDVIQARYADLDTLAGHFGRQSEAIANLHSRILRCVEVLERGAWQGAAATAFFAEIRGELNPAMQRFSRAMIAAQAVTLQAKDILRQAEEEAAGIFKRDMGVPAVHTTHGRGASNGNTQATPAAATNGQGASIGNTGAVDSTNGQRSSSGQSRFDGENNTQDAQSKNFQNILEKHFDIDWNRNGISNRNNCSGFVKSVAKELGLSLPDKQANDLVDYMSENWTELTREQAIKAVNEGKVIIAGLKGERHGHVTFVVPGELYRGKYPKVYGGAMSPAAVSTGNKSVGEIWRRTDRDSVRYFMPSS